ncbi:MAG: hypothetical protein KIT56_09640 [Gammaproteobacteria bacterium]|nr:hypothetical protein [Gammaproteobacteria bacterium]MCW5584115.1 hypothetical protein [Gammaproteobacteria bacterium]
MHKKLNLKHAVTINNVAQLYHTKYRNIISKDIKREQLLKNTLFSSQTRIIYKPLTTWVGKLRKAFQCINYQRYAYEHITDVVDIFNHAAILFIMQENYQYAREICYSQIQLFINLSKKYNDTSLLKYIFQPWINLVKIDRWSGNDYDAFSKLDALMTMSQSELTTRENKMLTKLIYESLEKDYKICCLMMKLCLLERIKLYLCNQQYAELIYFLNNERNSTVSLNWSIIQEARIVALANLGNFDEALNITINKKLNMDSLEERVFYLRNCEIYALLPIGEKRNFDADNLFNISYCLIHCDIVNVNSIYFSLHAAYILLNLGLIHDAVKLLYSCLSISMRLEDDILKAECLIMLYQLVDGDSRKNIEDLMIKHYFNTQYVMARHKMLNCFQDLIYVEQRCHVDELSLLFEDILGYCNYYL